MRRYNKIIGIGGWKCYCCGPSPKHRKLYKRHIKRIERREEMKIAMVEYLTENQKDLDPESAKILQENIWELYEGDN